jgi:mRNA interferase MazF
VRPGQPARPARRGELWFVDFGPPTGREQALERPAVILQRDELSYLDTVIVVPVTTNLRRPVYSGTVLLNIGEAGLREPSLVLCHHIRVLDRGKLKHKIGDLPPEKLSEVEAGVLFVCAIP